jgi:peptidoglycan hydrolase-like protein with peptidoglycan-binding domain
MPVKYLVPVDAAGHTLRADFAAAYLRAQADGMPAGGVDVFSRTLAQQAALVKVARQRGVVTAPATENAPHVSGRAMDMHTTNPKTRAYDPSPAHVWLTDGGKGGSDPAKGEKLRGHKFGMYRTVPSERWHFGYLPEKDTTANADLDTRMKALGYTGLTRAARVKAFQTAHGLTADGKAGPQTWYQLLTDAKPKPPKPATPPKPKTAQIKMLVANLHDPRFGGPKDSVAQAEFVANLGPDLILTSESRPIDRDDIRAKGRAKLTYPSKAGTVGMIWDGKVFDHGPRILADYGDNYHGAVAADLTIRTIGRKLRIISTHTRPKTVATNAKKKADIQKAAALKSGLTILGGDLAKDKPGSWLTGWRRLTPETLDTMDDKGFQSPDSAWVFGSGVKVVKVELVNPGRFSDHRWLLITIEVSA